ncbi:hypothetical protein QE152_g13724 [Popillia japonica]|uniref:Transposase n=1 Tax=Popillia japonica TaxID=7064 RepID=A0AAW1LBX8_POPJA
MHGKEVLKYLRQAFVTFGHTSTTRFKCKTSNCYQADIKVIRGGLPLPSTPPNRKLKNPSANGYKAKKWWQR